MVNHDHKSSRTLGQWEVRDEVAGNEGKWLVTFCSFDGLQRWFRGVHGLEGYDEERIKRRFGEEEEDVQ